MGGLEVPTSMFRTYADVPRWEDYRGRNRTPVLCDWQLGGPARMGGHFGRPLSVALWGDLLGRLGVRRLEVYGGPGHGEGELKEMRIGPVPAARVFLDEQGNVREIELY